MIKVKVYNEDSEELTNRIIDVAKSWDYSMILLEAKDDYSCGNGDTCEYEVSDILSFLNDLDISENDILYIEYMDNIVGKDLRPLCKAVSRILKRVGMRTVVVIPEDYLNILVGKLYLYCDVGIRMYTRRILHNIKNPNPGSGGDIIC